MLPQRTQLSLSNVFVISTCHVERGRTPESKHPYALDIKLIDERSFYYGQNDGKKSVRTPWGSAVMRVNAGVLPLALPRVRSVALGQDDRRGTLFLKRKLHLREVYCLRVSDFCTKSRSAALRTVSGTSLLMERLFKSLRSRLLIRPRARSIGTLGLNARLRWTR